MRAVVGDILWIDGQHPSLPQLPASKIKETFLFPPKTCVAQMVNNLLANAGDEGSIPGSGRPSGEGHGNPLQYSCLENSMDREAWRATVRGVAKSRMQLSNFTFTFHFHALEKDTATHSSVLAWRIPGTGEPDGLLSMGSHRVGHN